MCMTHLLINNFIHLNLTVSFKLAHKHAYPLTVSEPLIALNNTVLAKYFKTQFRDKHNIIKSGLYTRINNYGQRVTIINYIIIHISKYKDASIYSSKSKFLIIYCF